MGVENLVPSNNMIYVPTLMPLCFASWMNMRPNTEAAADWITYSPFGTCRICIIEYTATIQQSFHLSESMTNDIIVQYSSHYVMVFMWSFLLLFEVPLQSMMDKSWVNLIWVGLNVSTTYPEIVLNKLSNYVESQDKTFVNYLKWMRGELLDHNVWLLQKPTTTQKKPRSFVGYKSLIGAVSRSRP